MIRKCQFCREEFETKLSQKKICDKVECKEKQIEATRQRTKDWQAKHYKPKVRTCPYCSKSFQPKYGSRKCCYKKSCEAKHALEIKNKAKKRKSNAKPVLCPYCREPFHRKFHGTKREYCYKPDCIAKHKLVLKQRLAERRRTFYNDRYRGRYSYFKNADRDKPIKPLKECHNSNCRRMHDGPFDICSKCQEKRRNQIDTTCMFVVGSDNIPYTTTKALYNPIN